MLNRAYSIITIKNVDEEQRIINGLATTPTPDRTGDIVDPNGAQFTLPLPFLMQHRSSQPIGQVLAAAVTKDGISIKAQIAKGVAPFIDEAWALIKSGLVRGLSIGFRATEEPTRIKGTFGFKFNKWELLEVSAVTIPANSDASIMTIKSIDQSLRASSGTAQSSPVASGKSSTPPRSTTMKGIPEQIAALEGERAKTATRIEELKTKCNGDPDELEVAEQDELDNLGTELVTHDAKLRRLHTMQGSIAKAAPVSYAIGSDPDRASRVRAGDFIMKSQLPAGTVFTRAVIAKARAVKAHMSMSEAAEFAAREWRDTPEVAQYIKANPGTGLSGNWAEPLNVINTVEGDFLAALRPATIVGRLPLRPSAFNVKRIVQNATNTAAWVGRAVAKPVGEGDYDTVQVDQSKIADIVVLTDDQIMSSVIDSVEATRQDLIGQIAQFADEQFTDPAVAAVANINPASVTNGVTAIPASGNTAADLRADLYALLQNFSNANMGQGGITLVMNSAAASGLAFLTNALGNPEFPSITVDGGSLRGMSVIVSDAVPHDSSGGLIIAIKSSEVFLAQNGGIRLDMSRDATIDMAGGNSPTYSLFQKNSVALRAEWWVSWKKARDQAVQYISGAAYAPA